jgi:GT2 family glycosyltransferase
MRVHACVLTYRETEMARRAAQSAAGADSVEVFFNGAVPGGADALRAALPDVSVQEEPRNMAFAEVVNWAARRAGEAALLFLTNDAWLAPGALAALVEALEHDEGLAAVMPLTLRAADPMTVHHAGGAFDRRRWAPEILHGGEPLAPLPQEGLSEAAWLDGAAVLYRPGELLRTPMHEGYGFYWEDVDWGLSVASADKRLAVARHARAFHETSPTTGRYEAWRHYMMARNRLLCASRHAGPEERPAVVRRIVLASLLLALRSPHRVQQRMRLRAAWDYLRRGPGDPPHPEGFR